MNKLLLAGLSAGIFISMNIHAEKGHDEHREHGSHTHGVTQLNIALEGKQLLIEIESPAANIVGFEHMPKTSADKSTLEAAISNLEKPSELFVTDSRAGCKSVDYEVESSMLIDSHDKHKDHHDEHHGDKHDKAAHSDFEAQYGFVCADPDKLKEIDIRLFNVFPKTHQINVQYIGDGGQKAARLDEHHHVFHLPKR